MAARSTPQTLPRQVAPLRRLPLTFQVRDQVSDLIRHGDLAPGQQIPSETEFAARFGVARTTVREALRLLEQDNLISVRAGLGRFVAMSPSLERPLTRLEGVTEMMAATGYAPRNKVLEIAAGEATDQEAIALGLEVRAPILRLERLRFNQADAEPIVYSLDVLPAAIVPAPISEVDWSGSLFQALETAGHGVTSATARIQAVRLPASLGRRLKIDARVPWLLLEQRHSEQGGRLVLYSLDYHRGDRFSFDVVRRRD